MLEIEHVTKTYATGTRALSHFSLSVEEGEIVAVVGGSGCGKSTLLRMIAGLDHPSEGRVRVNGAVITAPHPLVGLVFQEPRLLSWLTVAQNVGFGLEHLPRAIRDARVAEALARVGLCDHAGRWPRELSGGQAQRVAISRALVAHPRVLLLDEPFSALDAFTRIDLQDHMLDLWADTRPTLVLVTHDIEEALVLADRIVVMRPRPGRIASIVEVDLPRPRDRLSDEFEAAKRRLFADLGHARATVTGEETAPAAAI
ncbi:ABC transporter ATP-binding protein [Roseixanthobacter pseudopolyaromaticivorans]|uniref:ABC transporter ATP-binding protein n=1 Tax=Xanthobacteraceae TaxID=335928 RepID=UPI0037263DED